MNIINCPLKKYPVYTSAGSNYLRGFWFYPYLLIPTSLMIDIGRWAQQYKKVTANDDDIFFYLSPQQSDSRMKKAASKLEPSIATSEYFFNPLDAKWTPFSGRLPPP